jgi:hypothetical protein
VIWSLCREAVTAESIEIDHWALLIDETATDLLSCGIQSVSHSFILDEESSDSNVWCQRCDAMRSNRSKERMGSGTQSSLCRRLLHLFPSHSSRSRVVISIVNCRPDLILSILDVDRGVIAVGSCTKKEGRSARFALRINQRLGSSARTPHSTFSLTSIVSLLLPLRVSILDLEALLFVLSISCQC